MANIRPKVKVWLATADQGFLGPGALKLLKMTDELQSLKAACVQLELSYSKGWKIISNIERELGYAVLNRQQGGKHGGGCTLTEQGNALVKKYEAFAEHCKELVDAAYGEFFEE